MSAIGTLSPSILCVLIFSGCAEETPGRSSVTIDPPPAVVQGNPPPQLAVSSADNHPEHFVSQPIAQGIGSVGLIAVQGRAITMPCDVFGVGNRPTIFDGQAIGVCEGDGFWPIRRAAANPRGTGPYAGTSILVSQKGGETKRMWINSSTQAILATR